MTKPGFYGKSGRGLSSREILHLPESEEIILHTHLDDNEFAEKIRQARHHDGLIPVVQAVRFGNLSVTSNLIDAAAHLGHEFNRPARNYTIALRPVIGDPNQRLRTGKEAGGKHRRRKRSLPSWLKK